MIKQFLAFNNEIGDIYRLKAICCKFEKHNITELPEPIVCSVFQFSGYFYFVIQWLSLTLANNKLMIESLLLHVLASPLALSTVY